MIMAKIVVSAEEWLEYILTKHKATIRDIGDQRDPQNVIVCSCKILTATWKNYTEPLYAKHLKDVLEPYFIQLYTDAR